MDRILTVIGTRPEAIKMALVIKKLNKTPGIHHKLCITAQHRLMLDQILDFFEIKADFDLNVMTPGQDLNDITCRVLQGLKGVFEEFKPSLIIVHGDTTTSFAATLAAFYANIKIAHVEAGLRTYDLTAPFPEEANRTLTARLCNWHFAPTHTSAMNLERECVDVKNIFVTGNTVIDSLLFARKKMSGFSSLVTNEKLIERFKTHQKILLVTGHRRENFGKGVLEICASLRTIASRYPEVCIVYPVHLNPSIHDPVFELLNNFENIILTSPMEYPDFVYAMDRSWVILTDSGGVQEEAPSLGKPVLVMREKTERPEAVDAGTVILVGTDPEKIVATIEELLTDPELYNTMAYAHNPYGDGFASDKIVEILRNVN